MPTTILYIIVAVFCVSATHHCKVDTQNLTYTTSPALLTLQCIWIKCRTITILTLPTQQNLVVGSCWSCYGSGGKGNHLIVGMLRNA